MPDQPQEATPDLNDEYNLDSDFDKELDAIPEAPVAPAPEAGQLPAQVTSETPPKDPKTGKFTKQPKPGYIVALARQLGIANEDIDTASLKDLRADIAILQNAQDFNRRRGDVERSGRAPAEQDDDSPFTPDPEPKKPEARPDFAVDVDEQMLDPSLVKPLKQLGGEINAMRKQFDALLGENKALKDEIRQLKGAEISRQHASWADRVDGIFAKWNDPAFGGTATRAELEAEGDPIQARHALLGMVSKRMKKHGETLEVAMDRARRVLRGQAEPSPAEPQNGHSRISEEDWEQGRLARTTHRDPLLPKGERRAAKAVAQKMRDKGWTEEGTEEAGLPE